MLIYGKNMLNAISIKLKFTHFTFH